ncbi:protein SCAR2-like isoform X1 [Neltuma alba]|uniref:protein SCAR2-like isoform X1 n=1 Tax=Neltuma alba TaxID=207710 RepID=UPI0010A54082|nr:protein SCAR2-like isoform X1 [Prosopis alba]
MPLARYQIRNEYSLADPELYRAADKDDPEALLEGVAMAGLVGVLRQLGDLAQFAAEVFHDLHEEVMATAARGHGLMVRVQQLEAEVPSLEKAFLSQTHHSSFFSNAGIDWHPNLRSEQNLITREDLPRFVMDSYEECRGPPRLFLLDKFDVAGAGGCLKRYTDPSFFKESASSKTTTAEIHREKRSRRVKKKAARLRNGETPEVVPTHAKLHQLLLEERVENAYSNPARLVKLKRRHLNRSGVDAENGKSYMEKFLESASPDYKMVRETSIAPMPIKSVSEDTSEARIKVLEISMVSPVKRSLGNENTLSYSNEPDSELKPFSETKMETNGGLVKVHEQMLDNVTDELSYNYKETPDETELTDDGQKKLEACLDCYHSDDAASEVDNYVDALTTMDSEMETDNEYRPKNGFLNGRRLIDSDGKEHQLRAHLSNSQSFGDSSMSEESSSFKQDRSDEHNELQARLSDFQSIGTSSTMEENSSFKRDTGEEHMIMHAQFSDSQSVGNSSASEKIVLNQKDTSCFSHPEPFNVTVEDIKSERLSLSSTKYCEHEIENTRSDHLPQSVESQKPDCNKFVKHDDAEFQEEEISDSGWTATDSPSMHSAHLVSDIGVNSSVIQPTESQIIQTSDTVELHSTLADTDSKCLVEPNVVVVPNAVSTVTDDAPPVSSEKYPSSNLDDGDPCVQAGDSIQSSVDLELAPVINSPEAQSVERPSDLVEIHSSLADDEERKCHVECIAAVPDALSTTKNGAGPVSSSEECPLNNLDESDPYAPCDASLPISNDLELTPVMPTETQLVETPSEPVELEDDEQSKCQVESISATSNAFSITKNDTCPGDSFKEYSLNLDNGELYVHSDASQHTSNDLNLAPADECSNHSKIEILQDGLSKENYDESLAGEGVNSPQGHSPSMEVDLYSGAALPVDGAEVLDSKDESCIIASKLDCQDSSPAVETPPSSSLAREQFSYFTHEHPIDEPDSAGVEVLYSDRLSNSEETSRMDNDNDKSESTCSVDAVEDDGHLKQPSSPGFGGKGNGDAYNVYTEKVQSEDQADNLLETFPVSSDSCQLKMESNEAESSEIFRDMNAESTKNQLESSSYIISSDIISSSLRDPTNLEESPSSFSGPLVNEISNEEVARESLTELEVEKVVSQTEVASADIGLNLNRAESHDLSDSETSNSVQDAPLHVKHHHISSANDLSMVPEFSEPATQELESSSCQNSALPLSSKDQLVMETPAQFLQSGAGQQGADSPLRVENSGSEKFQSEGMHVSCQLGQERKSLAAESADEIHRDQPSLSNSLSQPDGPGLNVAKHVMDSLKPLPDPILPGSDINLGEMPPMPPLPPMQWRRGKVQHASKEEVAEVSQASFQPIQAIKTDDKGQFGLISSERETLQYQDTSLPVIAVEGDKIPYPSGFSVGVSGHPVAVPLQFPFMVNEANGQYNYLVLERSQMQNPFLTLPMVSTVKPSHGFVLASEREMVQYSNLHPPIPPVECAFSGHNPASSWEKLAQPPSQLIEETTSEAKEPTHSVSNLEGQHEDPSVTPMPPPSMEMVQHNHSLPPSEGEMASSLGHDPVSSQEKLAQPPSQLIEETTSEAKEPTHSVSNLEGEQEDPSVTPMLPSVEVVQHNHSLPPLEGEMASSLDIPATTSIETEGEKPNGISKNKLPRPRNPLIDAVAAHDKSKLRKVTQRSSPETASKIDERDSLLEQIRTKSFNLKPAVATRPNVQGPKTNLKVAAILERANAIRQALAGSDDEDDDDDSWGDS